MEEEYGICRLRLRSTDPPRAGFIAIHPSGINTPDQREGLLDRTYFLVVGQGS